MVGYMEKPTIILATSNGVGMGHLARAAAIATELKAFANPIIVSMAGGIADMPAALGVRCEYIPGRDRNWMSPMAWNNYLRDRFLALIEETDAKLISFDGVVPYTGFLAMKERKPEIPLVWMRRGLWKRTPQRLALYLQTKLVDCIIEPGDFAHEYDKGPTAQRKDSIVTSPVSLFDSTTTLTRAEARNSLGLDADRPAVLVQLGTGEDDMNEKMSAVLLGLIGWKDLQVVLTKAPIDKHGSSLAPVGLDVKIIRYFPLAKVLNAFDAAIGATGYNTVHELLPAKIPTVLVSTICNTDDQELRAKWCDDFGYALSADQANMADISEKVRQLQDPELRNQLSRKCKDLPATNGATEIAHMLLELALAGRASSAKNGGFEFLVKTLRRYARITLSWATAVFRKLRPYKLVKSVDILPAVWRDETDSAKLRLLINGHTRFEHLLNGSSPHYRQVREAIAKAAYGQLVTSSVINSSATDQPNFN